MVGGMTYTILIDPGFDSAASLVRKWLCMAHNSVDAPFSKTTCFPFHEYVVISRDISRPRRQPSLETPNKNILYTLDCPKVGPETSNDIAKSAMNRSKEKLLWGYMELVQCVRVAVNVL